jgi:hypothetical protein
MIKFRHSYKQHTTERNISHNRIDSPSQDTAELQSNLFITGIHQFLVINIQWSDFPCETSTKVKVILLSNQQYMALYVHKPTAIWL